MRFYLICIFLLGLYSQIFSNENIHVADSLFHSKQYFEAAIEFERLAYFSNNYKEKNNFRFQKALCYKALGNFSAAKNEISKVSTFGLEKNDKQNILYESALISYLDDDYMSCNRAMLLIDYDCFEIDKQKNLFLLATLNNIMLKNFTESEIFALKYISITASKEQLNSLSEQMHEFYTKKELPKLKNEKVFEWISIAPGMGQIYVGAVGEGITNITLNLAAFSFGVFQVINGLYVTGYFVGSLSINKFYFGGRTRAKNAFNEVNSSRLVDYNLFIKDQLVQIGN